MKRSRDGSSGVGARSTRPYRTLSSSAIDSAEPTWPTFARRDCSRTMRRIAPAVTAGSRRPPSSGNARSSRRAMRGGFTAGPRPMSRRRISECPCRSPGRHAQLHDVVDGQHEEDVGLGGAKIEELLPGHEPERAPAGALLGLRVHELERRLRLSLAQQRQAARGLEAQDRHRAHGTRTEGAAAWGGGLELRIAHAAARQPARTREERLRRYPGLQEEAGVEHVAPRRCRLVGERPVRREIPDLVHAQGDDRREQAERVGDAITVVQYPNGREDGPLGYYTPL